MKNCLFLPFLLVLAMPCVLNADIVLSFSEVDTSDDSTVTVIGSIADTGGSSVLTTYNIPVDIGLDGAGLPAGVIDVSIAGALPGGGFGTFAGTPVPGLFNYDFITSDSGTPGLTLSATPTDLFVVTLTVDAGVPVGTIFDVGLQPDPSVNGTSNPSIFNFTFDGNNANGADVQNFVVQNGNVEIVGVPEPSSSLLLLTGVVGLAVRRRR